MSSFSFINDRDKLEALEYEQDRSAKLAKMRRRMVSALNHAPRYFQNTMRNVTYRLRSLGTSGLADILKKAIKENEEFLLDLVRYEQLYESGINGLGEEIWGYMPYTKTTIEIKQAKEQIADRVTLRDTGRFYKRMRFVITDKGFYISSPTLYTPDLLEKYGEEVLRFTDENFNKVVVPLLRIYAFEAIYSAIVGDDAKRAESFAKRLKGRVLRDYQSLQQYT